MSSAKRRRKAQIARLIRLDANHGRLYLMSSPRRDGEHARALWYGCIVPLGDKLENHKPGAWNALPRHPGGPDVLMHRYRERQAAK